MNRGRIFVSTSPRRVIIIRPTLRRWRNLLAPRGLIHVPGPWTFGDCRSLRHAGGCGFNALRNFIGAECVYKYLPQVWVQIFQGLSRLEFVRFFKCIKIRLFEYFSKEIIIQSTLSLEVRHLNLSKTLRFSRFFLICHNWLLKKVSRCSRLILIFLGSSRFFSIYPNFSRFIFLIFKGRTFSSITLTLSDLRRLSSRHFWCNNSIFSFHRFLDSNFLIKFTDTAYLRSEKLKFLNTLS